jgi:hypothetical protein
MFFLTFSCDRRMVEPDRRRGSWNGMVAVDRCSARRFSSHVSDLNPPITLRDVSVVLNEIDDASGRKRNPGLSVIGSICAPRAGLASITHDPVTGLNTMQWTVSQQYIASVEASLVRLGCDRRLTYAEMRAVSNCWTDTIPPVQCAGQLQAGRLLKRRGTLQTV